MSLEIYATSARLYDEFLTPALETSYGLRCILNSQHVIFARTLKAKCNIMWRQKMCGERNFARAIIMASLSFETAATKKCFLYHRKFCHMFSTWVNTVLTCYFKLLFPDTSESILSNQTS